VSELERIERVLQAQLELLKKIEANQRVILATEKAILAALSPSYPRSTGATITVG
jgi:hypothetical protein